MKRSFSLLLVLALIAALLPGAVFAEEIQTGGTLKIAASDDWSTFDPFFQISLSNRIYNPMLFETLIKTGNGCYEPGLATEWSFNDDYTEITFKLREGVKFQDGSDFTAEDVLFNLDRAMDVDAGYHISEYFASCVSAEAPDDYTVVVKWSDTSFVIEDAFSRLYIICPETADDVATLPVGTGPFALKEWRPGERAEFIRNEYYWAEGQPHLDGVTILTITDAQSRVVNLLTGEVDIIDSVSTQDIELLMREGTVEIFQNVPPEYKNFSMNTQREPFNNKLVRQAINCCVDRETIREVVYNGQGDVRYLPLVETSPFYPEDLESYYAYDLEKAKALLEEAGYADGFTFTLTVNIGIDGCLGQAEVLQADLAKVGITANIEPLEAASYFPRLTSNDFDMVSFGTGEPILDPSAYFSGAAVARTTRNFFGIETDTEWFPRYAELIEQAASELDQSVRKDLYHEILSIMLEQGWTIPVVSTVTKVAARDCVENFNVENTAGEYHLENVYIAQ